MKYRIITHGNCMDGYSTAFMFKKYHHIILDKKIEEQKEFLVLGVTPDEIQTRFQCLPNDTVLDLPLPKNKVLFWCDHHSSNETNNLPKNYIWQKTPSCTGLIIDLAKEKGVKINKEIKDFKKAMDIMDGALYTKKQIKECFYPQKSYENPSPLLKVHMIGSMFHTKDKILNDEIFETTLQGEVSQTPLTHQPLWDLNPVIYHKAQLKGYILWRKEMDRLFEYDEETNTVIQDQRKEKFVKGVPDRFYCYIKYPKSLYTIIIRVKEDTKILLGIGCNIFYKEKAKVNIGALCQTLGEMFGEGSGGGHFAVGGATIFEKNTNKALKYILNTFKQKEDEKTLR